MLVVPATLQIWPRGQCSSVTQGMQRPATQWGAPAPHSGTQTPAMSMGVIAKSGPGPLLSGTQPCSVQWVPPGQGGLHSTPPSSPQPATEVASSEREATLRQKAMVLRIDEKLQPQQR